MTWVPTGSRWRCSRGCHDNEYLISVLEYRWVAWDSDWWSWRGHIGSPRLGSWLIHGLFPAQSLNDLLHSRPLSHAQTPPHMNNMICLSYRHLSFPFPFSSPNSLSIARSAALGVLFSIPYDSVKSLQLDFLAPANDHKLVPGSLINRY